MSDEIKDGFTRLKELAENIKQNLVTGRVEKVPLVRAQLNKLISDIDLLEAEIEFQDN